MRTTCNYCQGRLDVVREGTPPPHWGRLVCSSCHRGAGFAPTPMDEAATYTMPFGKFAGRTLAEIAAVDRGYLEWAAAKLHKPRMREVIQFFLDHLDQHQEQSECPTLTTARSSPDSPPSDPAAVRIEPAGRHRSAASDREPLARRGAAGVVVHLRGSALP